MGRKRDKLKKEIKAKKREAQLKRRRMEAEKRRADEEERKVEEEKRRADEEERKVEEEKRREREKVESLLGSIESFLSGDIKEQDFQCGVVKVIQGEEGVIYSPIDALVIKEELNKLLIHLFDLEKKYEKELYINVFKLCEWVGFEDVLDRFDYQVVAGKFSSQDGNMPEVRSQILQLQDDREKRISDDKKGKKKVDDEREKLVSKINALLLICDQGDTNDKVLLDDICKILKNKKDIKNINLIYDTLMDAFGKNPSRCTNFFKLFDEHEISQCFVDVLCKEAEVEEVDKISKWISENDPRWFAEKVLPKCLYFLARSPEFFSVRSEQEDNQHFVKKISRSIATIRYLNSQKCISLMITCLEYSNFHMLSICLPFINNRQVLERVSRLLGKGKSDEKLEEVLRQLEKRLDTLQNIEEKIKIGDTKEIEKIISEKQFSFFLTSKQINQYMRSLTKKLKKAQKEEVKKCLDGFRPVTSEKKQQQEESKKIHRRPSRAASFVLNRAAILVSKVKAVLRSESNGGVDSDNETGTSETVEEQTESQVSGGCVSGNVDLDNETGTSETVEEKTAGWWDETYRDVNARYFVAKSDLSQRVPLLPGKYKSLRNRAKSKTKDGRPGSSETTRVMGLVGMFEGAALVAEEGTVNSQPVTEPSNSEVVSGLKVMFEKKEEAVVRPRLARKPSTKTIKLVDKHETFIKGNKPKTRVRPPLKASSVRDVSPLLQSTSGHVR